MKSLTIQENERKLEMNNSGTVLLARLVPIQDIKLQKEFQELFPLIPANVEKITQRIKVGGYDNSQPVHLWETDGRKVLIDGHHRREGAHRAGLYEIPCFIHSFSSIDEALEYAISLQTERRNLSDGELLAALKVVDSLKARGLGAVGEKGKSATRSAEILGISTSRVEKTRYIERYASDDIKKQIERGEMTLNKAYQMLRSGETAPVSPAEGKEKKVHKEALRVLQNVKSFLDTDDVEGLRVFVQQEMAL